MRFLCVIPARYHSTRFPGKPLVDINGKSMIQRVYEQASKVKGFALVAVATDDERIYNHVVAFGGHVVMTSAFHVTGTERCNEVLALLEADKKNFDAVVNVQGDEPYIKPEQIDLLLDAMKKEEVQIATLAKKIESIIQLQNPNIVKVVVSNTGKALYFSRHPIPFIREVLTGVNFKNYLFYKHIGIYAYKTGVLKDICLLSPSQLEKSESLEQLRWLENDKHIQVAFTDEESIGIDTPEDLEKLIKG